MLRSTLTFMTSTQQLMAPRALLVSLLKGRTGPYTARSVTGERTMSAWYSKSHRPARSASYTTSIRHMEVRRKGVLRLESTGTSTERHSWEARTTREPSFRSPLGNPNRHPQLYGISSGRGFPLRTTHSGHRWEFLWYL